jgi:acyl dehydratase
VEGLTIVALRPKLKQLIGKSTQPTTVVIEKGQIRRFASAIGEESRIHFDDDAAREAGFRGIVAPPSFPGVLTPPELFLTDFGWDPQAVMHRAEEYEYFRPICAGDTLEVTHKVADVFEQSGGGGSTLVFAVLETRAVDERDRPVFKGRRVIVKLNS